VFKTPVGDTFLLCSDGLSDLLDAPDFLEHGKSASLPSAGADLVALANQRGGHDNITVLLVRTRQASRAIATTLNEDPRPHTEVMSTAQDSRPKVTLMMGPATPRTLPSGPNPYANSPAAPPSAGHLPFQSPASMRNLPHSGSRLEPKRPLVWIAAMLAAILITALVTTILVLYFTGSLKGAASQPQTSPANVPSVPSLLRDPSPATIAPSTTAAQPEPPEEVVPVPTLAPVKARPKKPAD
jgi:PPM family protein phosphatase